MVGRFSSLHAAAVCHTQIQTTHVLSCGLNAVCGTSCTSCGSPGRCVVSTNLSAEVSLMVNLWYLHNTIIECSGMMTGCRCAQKRIQQTQWQLTCCPFHHRVLLFPNTTSCSDRSKPALQLTLLHLPNQVLAALLALCCSCSQLLLLRRQPLPQQPRQQPQARGSR